MAVPGRKIKVKIAMVRIAALSFWLAWPIFTATPLSLWATRLKDLAFFGLELDRFTESVLDS